MEIGAVDSISVPEKKPRRRVPRESLYDLLSCPARGGVLGDVEVHDPAPVVGENDPETNRREAGKAAISARPPRIKSAPAGGPCGRLEAPGNVTLAPVSSGARAGCGDRKIQLESCSQGCVSS